MRVDTARERGVTVPQRASGRRQLSGEPLQRRRGRVLITKAGERMQGHLGSRDPRKKWESFRFAEVAWNFVLQNWRRLL